MLQRRYQYLSKDGVKWTDWFTIISNDKNPIQYKSGKLLLKNEYRTI